MTPAIPPMQESVATRGSRLHGRIRAGLGWNVLGFAVIGLSGVAMNLLIARFYPPWALGVFNTMLAIFIVAGQVGALGIQYSMIYHTPIVLSRAGKAGPLFAAGLLIACLGASAVVAVLYAGRFLAQGLIEDTRYLEALAYALVGIWFFPLNKVMLGYLNGAHRFVAYAVGGAARYVLIVAAIVFSIVRGLPGEALALSLAASEGILALALLVTCFSGTPRLGVRGTTQWVRPHLRFGVRALPAGIVQELNTRIDVLLLGAMTNAKAVGIYSMASIFAEGLYQLVLTLRLTLDPVLAPLVAHDRWNELRELTRRVRRGSYAFTLAVSLVAVMLYPYALEILVGNDDFAASWKVFGTLATGIVLSAGYIPFSGLLQQAGFPGTQSLLITLVMLTNVAGNILLIPAFGALGAAAATAFSQVCFVFVLRRLVARKLAFSL